MRLRLVGDIEPGLSRVFADVLGRSNVDHVPFTLNVTPEFDRADVFVLPSIEEGDSIVTYEAADRGLPILASPMGAGRMGAESGATCLIDPYDADGFAEALHLFAASDDLRHEWGALGRRAVLDYDWSLVGPRSFAALHRFFGDRARGG
jgi:glycosyltransferase involved in cell wall biosynthesis